MIYRASIVIPAHNEEHRMHSLLTTLVKLCEKESYAIFVVCNGCTDRTVEVASRYPGVEVIEIDEVGKHFALNEGDRRAGDVFPRLYCDADIDIDVGSIERLVETLTTDETIAAGPTVHFDISNCSRSVRNYYRALDSRIVSRWSDVHLSGRGLYGASREARRRFAIFPPVIADDTFFDEQFLVSERRILSDATLTLTTPKTFRELIRIEVRVVTGGREIAPYLPHLGAKSTPDATFHGVLLAKCQTLKQWSMDYRRRDFAPLVTYFAVKIISRAVVSFKKIRRHTVNWR
jgi:glycosyltransferase involved in cell wall biosynthesis